MTGLQDLAATERLLVALDFDGTLAPLVDEPMTARMTPASAAAVAELLSAPDTVVAFVSGRTLRDLRIISEHDDRSPVMLEASHGAEHWPADAADGSVDTAAIALRDRLRREAETLAAGVAGAWVEPKEFGFAVHTRRSEPVAGVRLAGTVDALMAREAPAWRRRQGHDLVEYSYRSEGKDAAVARLRDLTDATAVLFAGDDTTDEDALRSLGPGDLGVRVGDGPTAAHIRVADIAELAAFLRSLAHERGRVRQ